jgi:hypothetical protein
VSRLVNGAFECADGFRYDPADDAPDMCVACEHERRDSPDGLCGFCREDGAVGIERPRPSLTDEQKRALGELGRARRADIEARIATYGRDQAMSKGTAL